jgi:hypothetical protein
MASNKHSADGKIPENGLSSLDKVTDTPKELGMDSHGPNQMPDGIKMKKVSTPSLGSFTFR